MLSAAIVGVGPGLGAAIARRFAQQGLHVFCMARSAEYLEQLAASINESGGSAAALVADVADIASIEAAFASISKEAHIDVLVYNASPPFRMAPFLSSSNDDLVRALQLGCVGAAACARLVLPGMLERGHGAILYTGATGSLRGGKMLSTFSAGKFAGRALIQSLAREFGPQGIHCAHVVVDGLIDTEHVRHLMPNADPATMIKPDELSMVYWNLYKQPKSIWTQEVDVRPNVEKF